jgi:hypothetical protein
MMRKRRVKAADLQLQSISVQWQHANDLLATFNSGVPEAHRVAGLTLERYFDRLDELLPARLLEPL